MSGSWSYRDACRLRASAPGAKPRVPRAARRECKALISVFLWSAVEDISFGWGRSQQGAEGDRCGCNCQLVHDDPSPLVVSQLVGLHKLTVNTVVNFYYFRNMKFMNIYL
jgi:hypothetical protein